MQLGVDESAYRQQWRSRRSDIVLGPCSFQDTLAQIVQTLGGKTDEAMLDQLRSERVQQKADLFRTVEPEVLAALEALRARRLKLGVVTNCFAEDIAGLHGARRAGLRACRALWFASRWPEGTVPQEEAGLWHAADVVHAAMAA